MNVHASPLQNLLDVFFLLEHWLSDFRLGVPLLRETADLVYHCVVVNTLVQRFEFFGNFCNLVPFSLLENFNLLVDEPLRDVAMPAHYRIVASVLVLYLWEVLRHDFFEFCYEVGVGVLLSHGPFLQEELSLHTITLPKKLPTDDFVSYSFPKRPELGSLVL